MPITTHSNQIMLVSVGFGTAVILATESPIIRHEIGAISTSIEDHLPTYPSESGLYIWEGEIRTEDAGWVGSEMLDGDISWSGQFRKATAADLIHFKMIA